MEYREALEYLYGLINYEKARVPYTDLKLERMREFMERLGNPQKTIPTVLVAGTKGKGSTSYMLHRLFGAFGLRCGLFSKPHLLTFRERIRIDDRLISPKELARLVDRVRPIVEAMERESPWGQPTYFEVAVGLALLYFLEKDVDVAVVEVGLGGRLDATNVTEPQVTVITPVSFDHMEVLGNTLEQIAWEKAGILRSNIPLVLAPQRKEARRVILREAEEKEVPVFEVTEECHADITFRGFQGSRFRFHVQGWGEGEIMLPLLGDHQVENFLAALLVVKLFGLPCEVSRLQEVTGTFRWPGRVDVLSLSPLRVFDVAHNRASFEVLLATLRDYLDVKKAVCLLGFLEGKDCAGIAEALRTFPGYCIFTEPFHPKALPVEVASSFFSSLGVPIELVPDPYRARERAESVARTLGLPLLVAGSFYLARLFKEALRFEEILEEEVELC
uniref:tetrahydrofolate synthase n=1 Tax=Candidatus Caldatribacterium saccharofermentans TaxID=1454753 RepID=A0A7V4TGF1_9BACT